MAFFRSFGVNHAKDVTGRCGIACAAHMRAPPRNAADFLKLAENWAFLDRKPISSLNETVDGPHLRF
jgi:hypothetical protein